LKGRNFFLLFYFRFVLYNFIMTRIYFSILLLTFAIDGLYAVPANGRYLSTQTDSSLTWLRENFSNRKKIPPDFEPEILKALSFFPELKNHRIDFVIRKGHAPLSARPTFGGLLRNARKRKYKVFISSGMKGDWDNFTLKNTPYEARVGVLGHELSHVKNFSNMSGLSLIGLGLNHVSKSYMNRFEFRTDSLCIEQGMGEYLLACAVFARKIFNAPDPEQLDVKGVRSNYSERYMSPSTIRLYMADMKAR
jgi:hypothetical protein